jgi:hypothetical protein
MFAPVPMAEILWAMCAAKKRLCPHMATDEQVTVEMLVRGLESTKRSLSVINLSAAVTVKCTVCRTEFWLEMMYLAGGTREVVLHVVRYLGRLEDEDDSVWGKHLQPRW